MGAGIPRDAFVSCRLCTSCTYISGLSGLLPHTLNRALPLKPAGDFRPLTLSAHPTYKPCMLRYCVHDWKSLENRPIYHIWLNNNKKKTQLTQGLCATAVRVWRPYGRNLSSAGNPSLETNVTSIGKPFAKLWPLLYIQDGRQPQSWILSNRK